MAVPLNGESCKVVVVGPAENISSDSDDITISKLVPERNAVIITESLPLADVKMLLVTSTENHTEAIHEVDIRRRHLDSYMETNYANKQSLSLIEQKQYTVA